MLGATLELSLRRDNLRLEGCIFAEEDIVSPMLRLSHLEGECMRFHKEIVTDKLFIVKLWIVMIITHAAIRRSRLALQNTPHMDFTCGVFVIEPMP